MLIDLPNPRDDDGISSIINLCFDVESRSANVGSVFCRSMEELEAFRSWNGSSKYCCLGAGTDPSGALSIVAGLSRACSSANTSSSEASDDRLKLKLYDNEAIEGIRGSSGRAVMSSFLSNNQFGAVHGSHPDATRAERLPVTRRKSVLERR